MKKLIVCDFCDVEYTVKYNMEEHFYPITYCTFCGNTIEEEDEDVMFDEEFFDED